MTWRQVKESSNKDYLRMSEEICLEYQQETNQAINDLNFNPKLKDLDVTNCLLTALDVLFQGTFFKSQYDFNKAMNRRAKQSNLHATYKYAKRAGNDIRVGRRVLKAEINGKKEWLGLRLTTITDRKSVQALFRNASTLLNFKNKLETTNILIAADHLNQ